jgi:hypothetical protein
MVNISRKLIELEMRVQVEPDVIGVCWQDKPDEIQSNGDILSREEWSAKYPGGQHVELVWET